MACWTFTDYRDALLGTGIFGGANATAFQKQIALNVRESFLLSSPTYNYITNNGTTDIDLSKTIPLTLGASASSTNPLIFLCQTTAGNTYVGFKNDTDLERFKTFFNAGFKYVDIITNEHDCRCQVLDSFGDGTSKELSTLELLNKEFTTNLALSDTWAYVDDFTNGRWTRNLTRASAVNGILYSHSGVLRNITWVQLQPDSYKESTWLNVSSSTHVAARSVMPLADEDDRLANFPKPKLKGGNMLKVGWPTPASSPLMTDGVISGGLSAIFNAAQVAFNSSFNDAQHRFAAAFKQPTIDTNRVNGTNNPCMEDLVCGGFFYSSDANADPHVLISFSAFTTPMQVTTGPSIRDLRAIVNTMDSAFKQLQDRCAEDESDGYSAPTAWADNFDACFVLKGIPTGANKPTTRACCDGVRPYAQPTASNTTTDVFKPWEDGAIWSQYSLLATAQQTSTGEINSFKLKKYSYAHAFLKVVDMLKRAVVSNGLFQGIKECYKNLTDALCPSPDDPTKPDIPNGLTDCNVYEQEFSTNNCKVSMKDPTQILLYDGSVIGGTADELSRYPEVRTHMMNCSPFKFDICRNMQQTFFSYYTNMLVTRNMRRINMKAVCNGGDCTPSFSTYNDEQCCVTISGVMGNYIDENGDCQSISASPSYEYTPCDITTYTLPSDCVIDVSEATNYAVAIKSYYKPYEESNKSCLLHTTTTSGNLGASYEIPFLGTGFDEDMQSLLNPSDINIDDASYDWVEPDYNEVQGASSTGGGKGNNNGNGGGEGGGGGLPGGTTTRPKSPGLYWVDRTNTVLKVVQNPGGQLIWDRVVEPIYYRCEIIQWRDADINLIESSLKNEVVFEMMPASPDDPDPCSEYPSPGRPQVFYNNSVSLYNGIHAVGILGTRIFDSSDSEVAKNLMFIPPESNSYKNMLNSDFTLSVLNAPYSDEGIFFPSNIEGIGNRALTITANFECGVYPFEDGRMVDLTQTSVNITQGL